MRWLWALVLVLTLHVRVHDARVESCAEAVRAVAPAFQATVVGLFPGGGMNIEWEGHSGSVDLFSQCLEEEYGLVEGREA